MKAALIWTIKLILDWVASFAALLVKNEIIRARREAEIRKQAQEEAQRLKEAKSAEDMDKSARDSLGGF